MCSHLCFSNTSHAWFEFILKAVKKKNIMAEEEEEQFEGVSSIKDDDVEMKGFKQLSSFDLEKMKERDDVVVYDTETKRQLQPMTMDARIGIVSRLRMAYASMVQHLPKTVTDEEIRGVLIRQEKEFETFTDHETMFILPTSRDFHDGHMLDYLDLLEYIKSLEDMTDDNARKGLINDYMLTKSLNVRIRPVEELIDSTGVHFCEDAERCAEVLEMYEKNLASGIKPNANALKRPKGWTTASWIQDEENQGSRPISSFAPGDAGGGGGAGGSGGPSRRRRKRGNGKKKH